MESSTVFTRPAHRLNQLRQVIDSNEDRMQLALTKATNQRERQLAQLESRLMRVSPVERAKRMDQQLQYAVERLERVGRATLEREENRFTRLLDKLDVLSPLSVMRRGYSLTYSADRKSLVRSLQDVQPGDPVQVRLQDGWLDCQVWGMREDNKE